MLSLLLSLLLSVTAAAAEMPRTDYEWVAASQSNQALGPGDSRAGDVLEKIVIVPDTTAAGTVWLHDGGGLSQKVFVTGTLSDLSPITIPIGARSVSGDWTVTTGANVHVLGVGRFQ